MNYYLLTKQNSFNIKKILFSILVAIIATSIHLSAQEIPLGTYAYGGIVIKYNSTTKNGLVVNRHTNEKYNYRSTISRIAHFNRGRNYLKDWRLPSLAEIKKVRPYSHLLEGKDIGYCWTADKEYPTQGKTELVYSGNTGEISLPINGQKIYLRPLAFSTTDKDLKVGDKAGDYTVISVFDSGRGIDLMYDKDVESPTFTEAKNQIISLSNDELKWRMPSQDDLNYLRRIGSENASVNLSNVNYWTTGDSYASDAVTSVYDMTTEKTQTVTLNNYDSYNYLMVRPFDATTEPPFGATNFDLNSSILAEADPTLLNTVVFTKKEKRKYADRRKDFWTEGDVNVYTATYSDETTIEFELNIEFDESIAKSLAKEYGDIFGKIPKCLRKPLETVTINDGYKVFSGLNAYFDGTTRNVLVHVDQGKEYIEYSRKGMGSNMLEETLIHEAVHSCLDDLDYIHNVEGNRQIRAAWKKAMDDDKKFISHYAKSEPKREDMAESFLAWLAVRYHPGRLSPGHRFIIEATIPNRLKFFDNKKFDVTPMVYEGSLPIRKIVTLSSENYPERDLVVENGLIVLRPLSPAMVIAKVNQFKVVKALNGKEGYVSFESVSQPNHFIRHQGFVLKLHPGSTSNLYTNDASFKAVEPFIQGNEAHSFISSNFNDRYIRHSAFKGLISSLGKTTIFKRDATWIVKEVVAE